jgi:hypothetical protein
MHTNKEKAIVLSQSVLRIKDIRILLDCGPNVASDTAKEFKRWYEQKTGYATKQVPTEMFIQYKKINEKRILQYAERGY